MKKAYRKTFSNCKNKKPDNHISKHQNFKNKIIFFEDALKYARRAKPAKIGATFLLLFFILLIALHGIIASAENTHAGSVNVTLEKDVFSTDEMILIRITGATSIHSVAIQSETKSYKYSGEIGERLEFYAREEGDYTISVFETESETITTQKKFQVRNNYFSNNTKILSTDKQQYQINENVNIQINASGNASNLELKIVSDKESLKFLDELKQKIIFIPKYAGQYKVQLRQNFEPIAEAIFSVTENNKAPVYPSTENHTFTINAINNQSLQEQPQANLLENSLMQNNQDMTSSKNKNNITKKFKIETRKKNGEHKDAEIQILKQNQDLYDIELYPEIQGMKSIRFNNLKIRDNDTTTIDIDQVKLKKEDFEKDLKEKKVLTSFFIDPSALNFTNGTITLEAKGRELWKCKDWNSTTQKCYGQWNKIMNISPGTEYDIPLNPEDPAYIETGVASINTRKSIYHPNETAEIILVALDTQGHLVSNANLNMTITTPTGDTYSFSTQTGEIIETEPGIYETTFQNTEYEGNYTLFVVADSPGLLNSTMETTFSVKSNYEFDVLRETPVTIDPWQGEFKSRITIISHINVSTFGFTEIIPSNFEIVDSGGATIKTVFNQTFLRWSNLTTNTTVSYTAKAPRITPDLYALGPAIVDYQSTSFYEARPWYITIDPATSNLLPDADGNYITWTIAGSTPASTRWDSVNDPIGSPDNAVTYIASPNNANRNSFSFQNLSLSNVTIQWVAVRIHARLSATPGSATLQMFYRESGTDYNNANTQALTTTWTTYSLAGWNYTTNPATGTAWNLSTINNMEWGVLRSAATINRLAWVTQMYVTIQYSLYPTIVNLSNPANNSDVSRTNNISFNFTATDDETPISNCTLWTNITGSWIKNITIYNVTNNTNTNISLNNISDGTYVWNVLCTDIYGGASFNTNNNTFTVSYYKSPKKTVINLDNDTDSPWVTINRNPYINISLDKNGACRISQQNKSYADMINNVNCTGSGTSIANCTFLGSPLSIGTNNFYIACNSSVGVADTNSTNIYLSTDILCDSHSDCLSTEYCDTTQHCAPDILPGYNCLGIAYTGLGNNEVCGDGSNKYCVNDSTYSFTGWYCTGTATDCVYNNNGNTYALNYKLCTETPNDYRTCSAENNWSLLVDCAEQYDPHNQSATTHSGLYCGYYASAQSCINGTSGGCNGTATDCTDYIYNQTTQTCGTTLPACDIGCGASCDTSNSTTANILANTCYYDKSCSNACTWSQNQEEAPVFCINDNDGGICAYSSRSDPTISDTCYWSQTCANTVGAGLSQGTSGNLKADYCDYCNTTGNQSGQYAPISNASCSSNCANTGTIYYDNSGTPSNRSDDCDIGISKILSDTLTIGDVWNGTSPAQCNNTECNLDCNPLVGTCNVGVCTCTDQDYPILTLLNPQNNTWTNNPLINFTYNVTDIGSQIRNCSLYINGSINQTNITINKSISIQLFNVSFTINGTINWNIICYDNSTNSNMNQSETRITGIDTEIPILRNASRNATNFTVNQKICINITANDSISGLSQMIAQIKPPGQPAENITLFDNATTSCDSTNGNYVYSAEYELIYSGTYNWTNAYATDQATNKNTTTPLLTWNVTAGGILNVTMTSPTANIKINESEYNFRYQQTCSVNCTNAGVNCTNVVLFIQYQPSTIFLDINTTTTELTSNMSNRLCGNMTQGTVCIASFNITSGANSGNNTWPLRCAADSENSATSYSASRNLTINKHPTPNFYYPQNNSWVSRTIIMNVSNSSDADGNITRYVFDYDNTTLFSSPTTICSTNQSNCTFNTTTQNQCQNNTLICYIRINITDSDDLNSSTYFTIGFDTNGPITTIISPANFTNITSNNHMMNATAQDNEIGTINSIFYEYRENSTQTWKAICNSTISQYNCSWNTTSLLDGNTYETQAYSLDEFNNTGNPDTSTNITIDRTGPEINLENPPLNNYSSNITTVFTYNATDATSTVSNCSIIIDSILNSTQNNPTENITLQFTTNLSEGTHYWNITCTDTFGNQNTSQTRNITIDTLGPTTTLDLPTNYANITGTSNYKINATATDPGIGTIKEIYFEYRENETSIWTSICTDTQGPEYNCTWNLAVLPDGSGYQVRAYATDQLGNNGSYDTHTNITTDNNPPQISLIYPPEGHIDDDGNIIFKYSVNDLGSNVQNCTLIINRTINQTQPGPLIEEQEYTFEIQNMTNHQNNWSINCTDTFGQIGNSEMRNFTINIQAILKVNVTTNTLIYRRGNQEYEIVNITNNITGANGGSIFQANTTTDIIRVYNTTEQVPYWWNTSWKKRKPIFLSTNSTMNLTNVVISINITGLSGNITSCANEIRIVDIYNNLIKADILAGDNANYCEVLFLGNITANASRENNYFAYYNNSASSSSNPANLAPLRFSIFFENFEGAGWNVIASEDPTLGCSGGSGLFNGCLDFTTDMDIASTTGASSEPSGTHIMVWDNTIPFAADRGVFYNFSAQSGCGGDFCDDIIVSGYVAMASTDSSSEYARIWARNQTGTTYTQIYQCTDATSCEFSTLDNTLPTLAAHYTFFNQTLKASLGMTLTNTMFLHIGATSTASSSNDNFFFEDINITGTRKQSPNITFTGTGTSQEWVERMANITDAQGISRILGINFINYTTSNYSAATRAEKSAFIPSYNYTFFEVANDNTPPNVSLQGPINGTESNSSVTFSYRINDALSTVSNCSLIIDNIFQEADYIIEEGQPNFFFPRIPSGGWHNWSVNCTDYYNNTGTSESWEIFIIPPDLKVNLSNVRINNTTPKEGDNIRINATFFNIGGSDALNAIVQFFLGDPENGGIQIGQNFTVNITDINGLNPNVTLNTSYIIDRPGPFNFFAVIDPTTSLNGSIFESNESNNKANLTIHAPGYHYFYGNVENNIYLASQNNDSFYYYLAIQNATGSVLATSNTVIMSFNSLQAIGMTTSNTTSSNDFSEIDTALNMSSFNDSINNVFAKGANTPIQFMNMSLFNRTILNVPVVNSTNTSNFKTGILWDTSDGGTEYTGVQDVVFITLLNLDKEGSYGTYDYEIKLPVLLENFNLGSSIEFYWEITS